ncbi:MAG TPA: glycosyltransferase family 4 protein [Methanofastidiosum sp.]|nr:glycosyltransferase family 4 protein [Methanofastidiosum sp.]
MRIIFLIREEIDYSNVGASRFLYLSEVFKKNGFESVIVGLPSNKINPKFWGITTRIILVRRAIKEINRNENNILFIREPISHLLLYPIIKVYKINVFYDFHGYRWIEQKNLNQNIKSFFMKIVEKISLSISDYIICISRGVLSQLNNSLQKKALILENGVDLRIGEIEIKNNDVLKLQKKLLNKKVVGFVADKKDWFNIDELINASSLLDREVIFLIIGGGYDAYMNNKYYNVMFLGRMKHNETMYILDNIISVAIVPYDVKWKYSNVKNYFSSRKVKEYLAAGKPIVMSDVKGKGDFLKVDQNILIYNSGDYKMLADKINTLFNDKKLYAYIRKNNLDLAKNFSWEHLIEKSNILQIIGDCDGK